MTVPETITAHSHICTVCEETFYCTKTNCNEDDVMCGECSEEFDDIDDEYDSVGDYNPDEEES